jgi:hypothetical protein
LASLTGEEVNVYMDESTEKCGENFQNAKIFLVVFDWLRAGRREVGVRVLVGARIFSSPSRPDWLWGSPNLPSNGYTALFPRS